MLDSIPSFARLVAELAKFPGVGKKTATRLAFSLLARPASDAEALAVAVLELHKKIGFCSICFHLTETDPCPICTDPGRDERLLCVVEQPQDLLAIERSRSFRGRYHVLQGALSPLDGIGPEDLR
ncbi:MAG: recombination protein RecR, partial [Deltaproteobacteria bacterium]